MVAVVFPGQGSQKPGMGRELVEARPEARTIFDRVAAATGIDLEKLCWETDEETLRQTQNAQLALYACGVAAWSTLPAVTIYAGHSVGEYAALAAAGIVTVEDGARLVRTRGELMARSGEVAPGTMAAVLGLDREALQAACEEAGGIVVIANDNSPGQLVISGEVEAVRKAGEAASAKGAKRVIALNVSGAFHSPLMESPAREMAQALAGVPFVAGATVYANVTSEPVADPSLWPGLLENQLKSPVRWTESVTHMVRDGVTTLIECGSGEVLSGLARRIDKSLKTLKVHDRATLEETLQTLAA